MPALWAKLKSVPTKGRNSIKETIRTKASRIAAKTNESESQRGLIDGLFQASGLVHRRQAYRKPGQNVPFIQYTRMDVSWPEFLLKMSSLLVKKLYNFLSSYLQWQGRFAKERCCRSESGLTTTFCHLPDLILTSNF